MDDALAQALDGIVPTEKPDDEKPDEPDTVELKKLRQAFVMIAVPIDMWDEVSELVDQIAGLPGVDVATSAT